MKKLLALSTICISAALTLPVSAQSVPNGCFTRDYSDAHLAAHPDQVVDWITVLFRSDAPTTSQTHAQIRVQMAHQGRAAQDGVGGMVLTQDLSNLYEPDQYIVDGDGGTFRITALDAGGLTLRTHGVFLSRNGDFFEEPSSTLSERADRPTSYRLNAAPLAACR